MEGLKVQKLLVGASFLSVQKVALGILGACPILSVPHCHAVSVWRGWLFLEGLKVSKLLFGANFLAVWF